jgi:plasmid stabilization system protein ParE
MKKYTVSPLAQSDIKDIWDYTAKWWNVDRADAYVRQIMEAIGAVADKPRRIL